MGPLWWRPWFKYEESEAGDSSTAVASAGMWKLCWSVVVKVKLSIYWLFYISTLRPRAPVDT